VSLVTSGAATGATAGTFAAADGWPGAASDELGAADDGLDAGWEHPLIRIPEINTRKTMIVIM